MDAVRDSPRSTPDARLQQALASRLRKMELGRLALACLEDACRHHPEDEALVQQHCEHLLASGAPSQAAQVAEEALARRPSPALRLLLARALAASGRLSEADAMLAALLKAKGLPSQVHAGALVHALQVALATDHPRRAQALALRAVELDPIPAEAARALGDLAGQLTTWSAVHREVERRRRAHPETAIYPYLSARLLASARSHHEPGIPQQEIERLLGRALRAEPGFHLARLMLALRQVRRRFSPQGTRAAALDNLRFLSQSLRLNPEALGTDAGFIDLLLGALLEETPETHREAVDAYLAGLRRLPGHAVAATNLGALYLRRGDVSAARERFLSALAADPDYAPVYRHLVRTLDLTASPEQTAREVEALVARLGAPRALVTGRFVAAMAEDAREQALSAVAGKATQLEAQLGLLGARLAAFASGLHDHSFEQAGDLPALARDLQTEWTQYARSLEPPVETHPEVLDLRLIVQDVVRRETRDDGRVEVTVAAAPADFPDVKGYRSALLEAVAAILRNGLEAQPEACPPLQVLLRPLDRPATRVEFTVRDFGEGIHALHRFQLFSPGYTTKRHRPGYGLSVARRVATAHQGWIVVEPAPERGTRVRLVLPVDLYGLPGQLDVALPESLPRPAASAQMGATGALVTPPRDSRHTPRHQQ